MKVSNTSNRLKELMIQRELRQVDILAKCQPFCRKYNERLGKNDLSQYVTGKTEPGQRKLTILSLALGVNETWLMGYDTHKNRGNEQYDNEINQVTIRSRIGEIIQYNFTDNELQAIITILDGMKKKNIVKS